MDVRLHLEINETYRLNVIDESPATTKPKRMNAIDSSSQGKNDHRSFSQLRIKKTSRLVFRRLGQIQYLFINIMPDVTTIAVFC